MISEMAVSGTSSTPARRSHRRIHAAVDAVLDVAAQKHAGSLLDIVHAVGESRGRPVIVAVDDLAPGVWGQRREYEDHDEIILARSLPSEARTLAHELGHVVFRHPGTAAEGAAVAADDDLIAYMLRGEEPAEAQATPDEDLELQEWEAEAFAARLLQRLGQLNKRHSLRPLLRYDEALG
ncbi:protein of unknown function [Gordonia malaquae]|uniref:Uncharacterized protein n=2 Tax=Gordonia malaquae TaxID=410332 RepID=M3V0E7_GORML|nr:hypothetical protein GM1_052_00040 [Gordonia malaquae NBRC 108250]SEE19983.1 protein of unknown function [Gordonia malaquae]